MEAGFWPTSCVRFFDSVDWIWNVPALIYCGSNVELQKTSLLSPSVLLLSQSHVTMAETTIIECTFASTNQNYPNLEPCNTYEVRDLKIDYVDCTSSSTQMFIIHLNTRSLSKNIIYNVSTFARYSNYS